MQVDVGAVAFHADKLEVTAEVASVQARDGQSVAEAGHGRFKVGFVEVWIEVGRLVDRGVHVCPDQRDAAAWNSTTLVADFDGDVLASLAHNDLCDRELLFVGAMSLDNSSQAVLQGLEKHVRQVSRDVHEVEVWWANQAYLGRVKQAVVILANKPCVLDGFLRQVADVGICTDDADIVRVRMRALVSQCDVLSDKHAYSYAAHVESVQESLDVVVYLHPLSFALVF